MMISPSVSPDSVLSQSEDETRKSSTSSATSTTSLFKRLISVIPSAASTQVSTGRISHTDEESLHLQQEQPTSSPLITMAEVSKHTSRSDLWMIINNKVYDATSLIESHPGGSEVLFDCAGVDATASFNDVSHSTYALDMLQPLYIGDLAPPAEVSHSINVDRAAPVMMKSSSTIARTTNDGAYDMLTSESTDYYSDPGNSSKKKKTKRKKNSKGQLLFQVQSTIKESPSARRRRLRNLQCDGGTDRNNLPFILRRSPSLLLICTFIGLIMFVYLQRKKWSEWMV